MASAAGVEPGVARHPPPTLVRHRALDRLPATSAISSSSQSSRPSSLELGVDRVAQRLQDSGRRSARIRPAASRAGGGANRCGFRASAACWPRNFEISEPNPAGYSAPAKRGRDLHVEQPRRPAADGLQAELHFAAPGVDDRLVPRRGDGFPERRHVADGDRRRSRPVRRRRPPGSGTAPAGRCVPRRTRCRRRWSSPATSSRQYCCNCSSVVISRYCTGVFSCDSKKQERHEDEQRNQDARRYTTYSRRSWASQRPTSRRST